MPTGDWEVFGEGILLTIIFRGIYALSDNMSFVCDIYVSKLSQNIRRNDALLKPLLFPLK